MQAIKTVMEHNQETFESKVNGLLESGYRMVSGDCKNFNPSGQAEPCWVAILVKEAYKTITPQLTLNIDTIRESVDVDYVISEISKTIQETANNNSGAACI